MRKALSAAAAVGLAAFFFAPACHGSDGKAADGWKTRAELSYVNTSGNSETQTLAGKFSFKKKEPVNRYFVSGSLLRTVSGNDETANRITFDARGERVVSERLFVLLSAGYLSDRFSGYDYRLFAGPGAGYDFIDTDKQSLNGTLTLLFNRDDFSSGPSGTDDYWFMKAVGDYSLHLLDNTLFGSKASYSVSLKDTGRAFADLVTSVEVKVNGAVSIGVSYTVNYQSAPPDAGVERTDTTLLTTLIVDF